MNWWLTQAGAPREEGVIKRFDPRHWTVDFPRGAMASLTGGEDAHSLVVRTRFSRKNDLVGLIWSSEDVGAHPALARETARDYRHCRLSFRWTSTGLIGLDAVNGPTLTIEGTDSSGAARTWFVRLWNYAQGSPTDATVSLDFGALDGGFALPADADRVDPARIERMFISLVPPGYDGASSAPLAAPLEARVEVRDISCEGSGSVLDLGDAMVPPHGFAIATAYDDQYHQAPERIVEAAHRLGYRGTISHYVGMSHYPTLDSGGTVDPAAGMNLPALEWHRAFARAARDWGFGVIWSLSFELLDEQCPEAWKQRAADGSAALTGYTPPSTLVSPASGPGVDYLAAIAAELVDLAVSEGLAPMFQVGEPWWWVTPDRRPCLYDDAAKALLGGAPVEIGDVRGPKTAEEIALLDSAGSLLASATQAIVAAARSAQPATRTHLLTYLPGSLAPDAPELKRANMPLGWAAPAFDRLQLEDYEWVTAGRSALSAAARQEALERLGYGLPESHYFSGFASASTASDDWERIVAAAKAARADGVESVFIWALPQVLRDGLTLFGKDAEVQAFDDVDFPIAIGMEASVSPAFSTDVVTSASGHEYRNAHWQQARLRFDAGPGVRGEDELAALISFFRARRGPAVAFRFRDPFDFSSVAMTGVPGAADVVIGTGDGTTTAFPLAKPYGGGERRRITRPVAASVRVSIDGAERTEGWTLEPFGVIQFDEPPAGGMTVAAGFLFDVPVRFAEDRLDINRETFLAGQAPSVPLVEVREG